MIPRRSFIIASGFLTMGCGKLELPRAPDAHTLKASSLTAVARAQIGVTTIYDPAYAQLDYPGGDVPRERGVCTDVIIRVYRDAFDLDLQELVHKDMRANFAAYPKRWGLAKPDRNIDHRRVPNLQVFFSRKGTTLPVTNHPDDYRPGDLVTMKLGGQLPHIGIVSNQLSPADARPLIIHNIGRGTQEEDILFTFDIDGHYSWFG
jgi:uncharacterized protein